MLLLPFSNPEVRIRQFFGAWCLVVICKIILLNIHCDFRTPRTKQEIEADYQRRKIVRKFKKKLQKFEDTEMDPEMDLKKGETDLSVNSHSIVHLITFSVALEKIRAEFQQDESAQKLKDDSSDSNDESHYDDGKKTGAKKKRLLSVPKRDQLINTIYQGYNSETTNPPSPVNHFSSLEAGGGGP